MGVALVEALEFRLDGDLVRMRTSSGGECAEHAMSICTFMETQIKARAVVAQWHVRGKADVVPITAAKRRR